MIKVKSFTVTSKNRVHEEPVKSVNITPEIQGTCFEFLEQSDLDEFKDQLRQSFEFVFVFGCEVYSFNTLPCGGCGQSDPNKRCLGCLHQF